MSLLHRSNSHDSLSRRLSSSSDDIHGRRFSYNPVEEFIPPTAHEEPISAYEVSKSRRISQVVAAIAYCLFAAGIVFGYAALKQVLVKEEVYRDRCTKKELKQEVDVCFEQEIHLNLMFTIAAVATNVSALPVGTVLDRFGPRLTSIVGCVFLALGCLFMAFARDMRPADGYIPGYFFLALGGPFIFISCFQLSNTFPRHSGLILAFITGAFDTSSAIFLFYRLIYSSTNGAFKPKKFFLAYLVVPAVILILQLTLMPGKSYKTVSELARAVDEDIQPNQVSNLSDDYSNPHLRRQGSNAAAEITSLLGNKDATEQAKSEEAKRAASGVWGALHGRSAWQQIRTPWFVLITMFTVLQMLRINFFVATVRPQYTYLLQSATAAEDVNSFFDIALPLGGVVAIPFIGFVLDNTSTSFVLGLLVALSTIIGVFGILPYQWAAHVNIILFVLYRPLYYTAVSDYAAKVFGFVTFGKVYGLVICLAGLFNFLQTPLDALTHGTFGGNPVPVNVIMLVVTALVGLALVIFVWMRSGDVERERLEEEAEGTTDTLMPGADPRAEEDNHPVDVHGYGTTHGDSQGVR